MKFEKIKKDCFEQIIYCQDDRVGLKAIIAIHSSVLGPATGGCRMLSYASDEEALRDVLNLSKGMTYKAAVANLKWGGAKAVIFEPEDPTLRVAVLERYGEFVERLSGHYITAKDVGISASDLRTIKRKTSHILGIEGEPGSSGDPSRATALGVYRGIQACADFVFSSKSLAGLRIAVQGLGSVSMCLIAYLLEEGAHVIACDINSHKVEQARSRFPIEIVPVEEIYTVEADVFCPCALGGVLSAESVQSISARIIAGAANNQLTSPEVGVHLFKSGKVYAPDYVINGGGLINIYYEDRLNKNYDQKRAISHINQIGDTLALILRRSVEMQRPTHLIADDMALERLEKAEDLLACEAPKRGLSSVKELLDPEFQQYQVL